MNATLTYDDDTGYTPVNPTYQQDVNLNVSFYTRAVKNEDETSKQGRPIFDNVDFVKIIQPGDNKTVIDTPVNEIYKRRFGDKFEKWSKTRENVVSGTPLAEWPLLTASQIAEFRAVGVHSVEALADMPDSLAQTFMGSHSIRQRAKEYLSVTKDSQYAEKQVKELEKRDKQIEELQRQMAELMSQAAKSKQPKE